MRGFRDLDPGEAEQIITSRKRKKEYLDELEAQMRAPKRPTGYDASPSERSVRPARRRTAASYADRQPAEPVPSRRAETYRMEPEPDRTADSSAFYEEEYYEDSRQYDGYAREPYSRNSRYVDREERQDRYDRTAGPSYDSYEDHRHLTPEPSYDDDDSWDGLKVGSYDETDSWEDSAEEEREDTCYEESEGTALRSTDRRNPLYDEGAEEDSFFELDEEEQILRRGRRRVRAAHLRRLLLVLAVLTLIAVGLGIFVTRKPKAKPAPERTEAVVMQGSNDQDLASNTNNEAMIWNGEQEEPAESEEPAVEEEVPPGYREPSADKDAFFQGYSVRSTDSTQEIVDEGIQSSYAVLINAETGEVVAQRDAEVVTSPASMTKIMTLLVAVEHLTDLDETVVMTQEVGDLVYRQGLSAVGYQVGDVIPVRDLLYGTILPSGADAAMLLAEHVAGSEEAFVEMMNDKVAELGLTATCHFTNPVGSFNQENKCTMTDMAMILKAAVENEMCRGILNTRIYTTSPTDAHPEGIEISNWFLRRIEDKDVHGEVMCAKTGFVDQSGCCAASYQISNDGGHYFCVTGNAWSAWRCIYDHVAIYDLYTN